MQDGLIAEYARTMATYNAWMNEKLYAACAQLSDAQRKRDLGAFFRSIHGTLNHILLADRIWMGRFRGQPYPAKTLDQELYADFEALRAARVQMDGEIADWIASLGAADFATQLSYVGIVNPEPRSCALWLAIVHFFNHQTHHRGQVTTLLKQSGIDPGVTDLIAMPAVPAQ
jgi:uncharacterized damage-inducible protein DinB